MKQLPANVARKAFWDAALGDNSKLANLAKAAITEAEQQAKVREWVGLTDDERNEIYRKSFKLIDSRLVGEQVDFVRAIESKLREKNAGLPAADDKAGGEPVAINLAEALEAARQSYPSEGEPEGKWCLLDRRHVDVLCAAISAKQKPQAEVRVPDGYVLVPESALRWLFGEEDAFECPPEKYFRGKPPAYWWRSVFRDMLAAAPKPQDDLPAILKKQAS